MKSTGGTWYGDFLRLPPELWRDAAPALGFVAPIEPDLLQHPPQVPASPGEVAPAPSFPAAPAVKTTAEPLTCWQPVAIEFDPVADPAPSLDAEDKKLLRGEDRPPPPPQPWFCWPKWEAPVRALIQETVFSRRIDAKRWVSLQAKLKPVQKVPRRTWTRWPDQWAIWLDADPALMSLWPDYLAANAAIQKKIGRGARLLLAWPGQNPAPRGPGLVLGATGSHPTEAGLAAGCCALTPHLTGPQNWGPARLTHHFGAQLDQLMTSLAVVVRFRTGLLRALRTLISADAGLEVAVLRHPDLQVMADDIFWRPGAAEPWQQKFKALPDPQKRAVFETVRQYHHGPVPTEVWWEELLVLLGVAPELLPAETAQYLDRYAVAMARHYAVGPEPSLTAQWVQKSAVRLDKQLWRAPAAYRQLVAQVEQEGQPPPPEKMVRLEQRGTRLVLVPKEAPVLGSPIVELPAATQVQFVGPDGQGLRCPLPNAQVEWPPIGGVGYVVTDRARVTLEAATQPPWASGIGRDQHGLFAEVTLQGVDFRMRWVPPGRFLMGSPENEAGRWGSDPQDDLEKFPYLEGPQHEVTHPQGFWLGATPVTQKLWEAVMGHNPSEFQKATHPVEQVSWDDVQEFLAEAEKIAEGIGLDLPTEAQWEYACRAGTTTATYAGDLEILGERNAPLLDTIGWYGGNCGVDFELKNGWDTRDWKEKQYKFSKGGTHSVGLKLANPWGLYDMLGNVWEWCADGLRKYESGPLTGPVGPEGPSDRGARVVRGGSWYYHARALRAAYRDDLRPGIANVNLGFRLFRGHIPAPSPAHPKAQEPNRGPQPARGAGEPEAQARGTVGAWGAQQGATKTPPEPPHSPEVALAPGTGDSEPVAP